MTYILASITYVITRNRRRSNICYYDDFNCYLRR